MKRKKILSMVSFGLFAQALMAYNPSAVVIGWHDWSQWDNSTATIVAPYSSNASDYSGVASVFSPDGSSEMGSVKTNANGGSLAAVGWPGVVDFTNTNYLRQIRNEVYYIDFEVTISGARTELRSFHFDAQFNNADAQKNWTLSIEPGEAFVPGESDTVTMGTVARGAFDASTAKNEWESFDVSLSHLVDQDLGPDGGTVIFRLSWWGSEPTDQNSDLTAIDNIAIRASVPEEVEVDRPSLGERADWLRGAWGINWKPVSYANDYILDVKIDPFIEQIKGLKTIDYIQLHLNESYIYSPVHSAPHDILESLWYGDLDANGDPRNLVVPRAASGGDPFYDWLVATKAAGLKTQIYLNSSQMLQRMVIEGDIDSGILDNPDEIPDITARWKSYCDTTPAVQAYVNSKDYHTDVDHPERKYMFCYAEFILKDFAVRYGDLVDAWLFDSGVFMTINGDDAKSGVQDDQRIYEAFTRAARAGNADVPVAFNNGKGSVLADRSPIARATLFDDYTFGHPFGGGKYMGGGDGNPYGPSSDGYDSLYMYDKNFRIIQWIEATNGNVANLADPDVINGLNALEIENDYDSNDYLPTGWAGDYYDHFTWDDKVVGHFDPPMSTTSWNSGVVAALTNSQFSLWNERALVGGGVISWGVPLLRRDADHEEPNYTMQNWALEQLHYMDDELSNSQFPNNPNWGRATTVLPDAYTGQAYYHILVNGLDFWDPTGNGINNCYVVSGDVAPDWLNVEELNDGSGNWVLYGTPNEDESTNYSFRLRLTNGSALGTRKIDLGVEYVDDSTEYPLSVWAANEFTLDKAKRALPNVYYIVRGVDFYYTGANNLSIIISDQTQAQGVVLSITEIVDDVWELRCDSDIDAAENPVFSLRLREHSGGVVRTVDADFSVTLLPEIQPDLTTAYGTRKVTIASSVSVCDPSDIEVDFDIELILFAESSHTVNGDETSFGVGDLSDTGDGGDDVFQGAGAELLGIGGLEVVNFNSNGSSLDESDIVNLSFSSVTILNANHKFDKVFITINDYVHAVDMIEVADVSHTIDFTGLVGDTLVESFSVGNVDDSVDGLEHGDDEVIHTTASSNKWSIESIGVSYDLNE